MEKLVKAVPGVARCRAHWDQSLIDIWFEADTQVDDEKIREAVLKANMTPGETVK